MDRFAIFVDAGYLLAEGGKLCLGVESRSSAKDNYQIKCNYDFLFKNLIDIAGKNCNLPLLRIYWYDGAKDGIPDDEQKDISRMPNVKIRLGRMTSQGQKGVDSLIYRDITTLAQNRSIATGYLLAGDEDLRIGISTAQDMGVRIGLLGVPDSNPSHPNQSEPLIREADELIILEKFFLEKCIFKKDYQSFNQQINEIPPQEYKEIVEFGYSVASNIASDIGPGLAIEGDGKIPPHIDRDLIRRAQEKYGDLSGRDHRNNKIKNALRNGFRKYLRDNRNYDSLS